jgi:hypothetical protein
MEEGGNWPMDWGTLVFGLVLGSCVTSILIWMQRPTLQADGANKYFARVALSAAITALVAGLARTALDYGRLGQWTSTGTLFGTGWLLGGLIAGWFLSGVMRRS